MTVSRLIARPMLASIFVVGPVNALRNPAMAVDRSEPVLEKLVPLAKRAGVPVPEDHDTLVKLNAGLQIVAALGLATGRMPRLSAAVLAASLIPTTAAGHRFWEYDDNVQRTQQTLHFFKNVSLLGGLIIAAGDTEGKPGVAWRAKRAARDARREARHLAAAARKEAQLAKAKVA